MKNAKSTKNILIIFAFLSTVIFAACDKKGRVDDSVGKRPDTRHNQSCSSCPLHTNKMVEALGMAGPGIFQAELGMAVYTDNETHTLLVGSEVSVEGYLFVDNDHNTYCFMREGRYDVDTITPGIINAVNNIEGMEIEARHQSTGEKVKIGFPLLGYANLVPIRHSTIDGNEYANYFTGQMIIQSIDGPQVSCASNALYLLGKPF